MKEMLWIGMKQQIPNLKLSDVEQLNRTVKGEIISMFGFGWAIIGNEKAKANLNSIKDVANSIKESII